MLAEFKDYYAILGLARDAGTADIRNAFRALARKHHPDVAKEKAGAENRFKEINEAHEVLRDPDKRRRYDELGAAWNDPGGRPRPARGGSPEGSEFHFGGAGFSEFFEQFFGSRNRSAGESGRAWRGAEEDDAGASRGQDIVGDILVTLDEVLHGTTRTIQMQRTDPRTGRSSVQTLRVKIPVGVREAQMIRLAGQGRAAAGGGDAGNLFLRVAFAAHPDFRVRGADLYHDLDVAPWEAVLGAVIDIPTLDGPVSLKIPPGTPGGRDFRLRGMGLPSVHASRGDLHAIVGIQVPTPISAAQKALWETLASSSTFNPRSPS